MATPEQPAKKRRSIGPYLSTSTGKLTLLQFIAGIGCFLWVPVEILFFGTPIKSPSLAVLIVLGMVIVALSGSNIIRNRAIKR